MTTWTWSALRRTNSRGSRVTGGAIHATGAGPSASDPARSAASRSSFCCADGKHLHGQRVCQTHPLHPARSGGFQHHVGRFPAPKPSPRADTRIMRNPHRLQVPWGASRAGSVESPEMLAKVPPKRRPRSICTAVIQLPPRIARSSSDMIIWVWSVRPPYGHQLVSLRDLDAPPQV